MYAVFLDVAIILVLRTRAHCDPMEKDRRSSFLFGRIFFDVPASTSAEHTLVFRL